MFNNKIFSDQINDDERQAFHNKYAQRQLSLDDSVDDLDDDDNESEDASNQSTTSKPERTTQKGVINNLLGGQTTTTLSSRLVEHTTEYGNIVTSSFKPEVTTRKSLVNRILGGGPTTTSSPYNQIDSTTTYGRSTQRPETTTRRGGVIGGVFGSSLSLPTAFDLIKPMEHVNKRNKRAIEVDPKCFARNRSKLPVKLDWNAQGKVTPPKYQGECGSCWAFASIASLESAYLIKGKTKNKKFDLSEQQLLNCATKNPCAGSTAIDAFNFILTNKGIVSEKKIPYAFKVSWTFDTKGTTKLF